jgi:ribosomal protein S16
MLKIRLSRAGKKNMPFFRIVVSEHTAAAKH